MDNLSVQSIRNQLERKKGRRDQIKNEIGLLKCKISNQTKKLKSYEEALEIIRAVALKTQQQLQFHISNITSLALETVYDEPYALVAEFVQRKNRTECDLYFTRDGDRFDPIDDSGGGTVNIASFALRVASWSMQNPKSRNTLILDEPFNNVSSDLLPKVGEMLQQISKKLKLQIIMITHSMALIDAADRTFYISKRNGISYVTIKNNEEE